MIAFVRIALALLLLGFFEVANQDETAQNSGFWKNIISGGHVWTPDGVHENQFGNLNIVSSGAVNSLVFH